MSAVQAANRRIYETAHRKLEHEGMGTTLTAVYLDDSNLAVAHVGDSRAYIFRDGELVRLTHDHSLVEELIRRGKLTPEQAAAHPQRSIITRALGIEPEVEVDTWTYPDARRRRRAAVLRRADVDDLRAPDRRRCSAAEPDLERAGERLIAEANEAGGRDNITVVLFRLEDVDAEPDGPPRLEESTAVDLPPVAPQREVDGESSRAPRRGRRAVTARAPGGVVGLADASIPSVPAAAARRAPAPTARRAAAGADSGSAATGSTGAAVAASSSS